MSSAGTSGASNAQMGNQTNANLNGLPLGTENAGDAPVETVEIIEVVETANPYEYMARYGDESPAFRWWYVPAVVAPIVAGGAIFWYAQKGKQPFLDARDLMARKGGDFADLLQDQSKRLPGATNQLKGKSAAALGAVATAGVLDKLGDTWEDLRDSATDLVERARVRENVTATGATARAQIAQLRRAAQTKQAQAQAKSKWNDFTDMMSATGENVSGWIADRRVGDRANDLRGRAADKAKDLKAQRRVGAAKAATKAGAAIAAAKTSKAMSKAGDRASHAAKKTGKRARSTWKRTRAFSFGLLVTAMATYIRLWRQRITDRTTRETAGGRLVRDA
ncbi:MAG TPA: hypothetical protein VJN88_17155 [Ktedonobacterales bacterium]|nr:hypothetical protein [Ktedonobacterales bacterium]